MQKTKGLVLLVFIFLLTANICFAFELEVSYPNIPGVSAPTKDSLPIYLLYIFHFGTGIGLLSVVLALIIAGIYYMVSSAVPSKRAEAKSRAVSAMLGLLLLSLTYLIVTTINPRFSIFSLNELEGLPAQTNVIVPITGAFFYDNVSCKAKEEDIFLEMQFLSSASSLGEATNSIRSAKLVHDPELGVYYIAVLYDVINYWGKCLYINPIQSCETNIDPFAGSISVYRYREEYKKGSVTFYRNSFFNEDGGFYEETKINEIKILNLNKLKFEDKSGECNVPEKDRACVDWDLAGNCKERECPTLAENNISSVKIDGDFFVLLVYYDPLTDKPHGPWTFCQAFPAEKDVNKMGPKQIKWESVRTQRNKPNYAIIFPVESK